MADSLLARAQEAVQMALSAGATNAWATASRSRSTELTLRDGKVEKLQEATSRSLSVEVYADGRYSSHTTTDLTPDRLAAFVNDAVALTRALPVDPFRHIPDPALFAGRSAADLQLVDARMGAISPKQREDWALAMDAEGRKDKSVISVTSYVSDDHGEGAAASSNGFAGEWAGTSAWLSCEVTVRDEGDKRPEGSFWVGGRTLEALGDAPVVGRKALERALVRLGAKKGPTVKTLMVVDPMAGGNLIARLLSPANAAAIANGRSFWGGKVGQKVVSDKLTIVDDPLLPRGLGSRHFDGEGIAAKAMPIVEAGVLKNLYVDTYYGKKAKLTPTTGSPSNRVIALGTKNLDQLLKEAGKAVYVTSWLGGNADATTLDFSFGIRGHQVENGQVGAPVGEMNVTGNLAQLFASLQAVGNDPWPYSATRVPTLVFDGVQFSGA